MILARYIARLFREQVPNSLKERWPAIACATLLLLFGLLQIAITSRKSITNDEIVHIPAGYYHLVLGEYSINREHPPLAKMLSAIPLLYIQPEEPTLARELTPRGGPVARELEIAGRFWQANAGRFAAVSFWCRLPPILLSVCLGLVIFAFARQLFSPGAALLSVALFVLDPTVLAHSHVVHTDMPASLGYLLFFFVLNSYSRRRTTANAVWLGLAASAALLFKFSMIVLAPAIAIFFLALLIQSAVASLRRRVALHSLLVFFIVWLAINVVYRFERLPVTAGEVNSITAHCASHCSLIISTLRLSSFLFPTDFNLGLYDLWIHNQEGHPASLLGAYSTRGWWYYFPVVFALKTTIPFLLLSVCTFVWAMRQIARERSRPLLLLVLPLGLYSGLAMTSHIDIGVRHLLPAFPFLFVLCGGFIGWLNRRVSTISVLATALLLCWMCGEAWHSFPDYIPYMNEFTSGSAGWQFLSDSNVEWGEDVSALASYLKIRGQPRVRAMLSGGWLTLPLYGIEYADAKNVDATKSASRNAEGPVGYIALGASFLNGSTVPQDVKDKNGQVLGEAARLNYFDEYRHRQPEAIFGKSIYLYLEAR